MKKYQVNAIFVQYTCMLLAQNKKRLFNVKFAIKLVKVNFTVKVIFEFPLRLMV